MKKLIFLFLSVMTLSSSIYAESEVEKKIKERKDLVESIILDYEFSCCDYHFGFDYHIGFLNGRANAYQDCLNLMKGNAQ